MEPLRAIPKLVFVIGSWLWLPAAVAAQQLRLEASATVRLEATVTVRLEAQPRRKQDSAAKITQDQTGRKSEPEH
jgi:hypothetical protein